MKRKACERTLEEKQERQQSKRKRKAFEAGSPYAFGHFSADAVLNRYVQSDETHDGYVSGDEVEEQIHKFRGLNNQQPNKRKIEIIDVDDLEDDHKLAGEKRRIEDEWTICHAGEDEYLALLQNMKKRRKGKHVLEESKDQCISISPSIPISEDLWSSLESDHHVNNSGVEGSFWYTNLEDGEAQYVSNVPISNSEEMFTNSVLNFENHHQGDNNGDGYIQDQDLEGSNVLCVSTELISNSEDILPYSSPLIGDRHGSNNGREGSFSWYIDLEDDKAEWVPYQPILKSEDILSNTLTLNFESDRHGNNGVDGYFLDKHLEDASPLRVSTQLISKFEDILPNSSPFSFERNQYHLIGDHHGNGNTNGELFSWHIDLEDDKVQCVPSHNDSERDIWNKDLDDGKALCVATQLGSKSEDILPKSLPLSFVSNHHYAVDDEHGNNNGDNGIFWTEDLEDRNAQFVLTA